MINIDPRSSIPIYQQIVDNIKESILRGILMPDERLPSVRELARQLTTNPNTIQKAYKELERQKVTYSIPGKGSFISEDFKQRLDEEKMIEIKEILKKCVVEAHYMGVQKDKMLQILQEVYQELEVEENAPN